MPFFPICFVSAVQWESCTESFRASIWGGVLKVKWLWLLLLHHEKKKKKRLKLMGGFARISLLDATTFLGLYGFIWPTRCAASSIAHLQAPFSCFKLIWIVNAFFIS